MSYFLPRLESGWHVDQAILAEDNRVVVVRFGHDWVRAALTLVRRVGSVEDCAGSRQHAAEDVNFLGATREVVVQGEAGAQGRAGERAR